MTWGFEANVERRGGKRRRWFRSRRKTSYLCTVKTAIKRAKSRIQFELFRAKAVSSEAGSWYHTAFGIMTDCDGLVPQFWMIPLLHSSKELIHIHMNDLVHLSTQLIISLFWTPLGSCLSSLWRNFQGANIQRKCKLFPFQSIFLPFRLQLYE